jgi:hypothetical protein
MHSVVLISSDLASGVFTMLRQNEKPFRHWREIAEEASREKDPKKLNDLAEELDRALTERDNQDKPTIEGASS